ncbi:DUF1697 domain-containing protein [Conexibacter sp. CPCC 206217]|uniref:DUF1697 domain-containing protein n=1 Tax=Conexibacter sp. CPCC 206217 TaxID=3064574 RepID=UPI0027176AF2|nr:DUF1697 domain-containing protein [Conexibacter sp. CPCC 206217]MDO8212938.1 DUF1697 domain-containing protein [Conexibacter sp. CPCC 206217]
MRTIALLRGINVGGNKKVPMADLRALMERLGFSDVKTYVQSGNVVFSGPRRAARTIAREIEAGIVEQFGFEVLITIRTRDELAAVVAANPLGEVATVDKRHHVVFLSAAPDPAVVAEIDEVAHEPERFELIGRELYVWTPEGITDSPLFKALSEKRLGVRATARNWRTVAKLLEMADADA